MNIIGKGIETRVGKYYAVLRRVERIKGYYYIRTLQINYTRSLNREFIQHYVVDYILLAQSPTP